MTNEITAEQIVDSSSEDLKKIIAEFRKPSKPNNNTDCHGCDDCYGCTSCYDCTDCKYMICNVQLTESQYFAAVGKLSRINP